MITEHFDQNGFNKIAETLLNTTILVIKDRKFRICEIEFYLYSRDHPDEYSHKNQDSLSYGVFTFHRYHNGTYRSGTWKGLDIAFGDLSQNKHCGILIRSIQDMADGVLTEGPCLSVNKILSILGSSTVKEYMKDRKDLIPIYNDNEDFRLEHDSNLIHHVISCGPRVGLSDKYPEYKNLPYRFGILTPLLKKQKNWIVCTQKA